MFAVGVVDVVVLWESSWSLVIVVVVLVAGGVIGTAGQCWHHGVAALGSIVAMESGV